MNWIILGLVLAVLTGIISLIHKKTLKKDSPLENSFLYSFFNMIIAMVLIPFIDLSFQKEYLIVLYFLTWIGASAFYLYERSLKRGEVSSVAPLFNFGPLFVALFAFIFLAEKVTMLQIFGILLLILGGYILETRHFTNFKEAIKKVKKHKYIHLAMISVLLYAFGSVGDKFVLNNGMTPLTFLFFVNIFLWTNFFIMACLTEGMAPMIKSAKRVGGLLLISSFLSFLLRMTQLFAITLGSIAPILALKKLGSLIAVIGGGELFHEHNLKRKLVASVIMIFGAILIAI